jgi:predicted Rossmann fold flavoprotein
MRTLGVELKREPTGKLFPVTDDAHTVLDAMLRRCEQLGVAILTEHRVTAITPKPRDSRPGGSFVIQHTRGELHAKTIVLATGGRSLPRTGSDGFGYELVRSLGHTVTPTHAALVPLVLADSFFHASLSGIAHDVELTTYADGKRIDRRSGAMLWTHFGISGPVVMDASRFWIIAAAEKRSPELRCSLLPGENFETVEQWLIDAAAKAPGRSVAAIVAERLPKRVADVLAPATPIGQLPREDRRELVHRLVNLVLPVVRDRGWNYAEVTAGGVPMDEVDRRTMASRRCAGLYLVGEILDVDGRIGGFNFQWAWATAKLAGDAVVRGLGEL